MTTDGGRTRKRAGGAAPVREEASALWPGGGDRKGTEGGGAHQRQRLLRNGGADEAQYRAMQYPGRNLTTTETVRGGDEELDGAVAWATLGPRRLQQSWRG